MHTKVCIYIQKKRFAYLANENLRNFQRMQEITKWFHAIAWTIVSISRIQGFLRTIVRRCVNQSTFLVYC